MNASRRYEFRLLTRGLSNAVVWRAVNSLFPGHRFNGATRARLAECYATAGLATSGFPRSITYNELQAAIRAQVHAGVDLQEIADREAAVEEEAETEARDRT